MRVPRFACPSRATATVVFPEPDSPTRPDDLARRDVKSDVVDDLLAVGGQLHAQPVDTDGSHASSPLPPTPATARETPSVMKFVPIANRAMHSAGARTAHGCTVIPARFSLIIRPQSAFGG